MLNPSVDSPCPSQMDQRTYLACYSGHRENASAYLRTTQFELREHASDENCPSKNYYPPLCSAIMDP
jgi:hypothetical protein